MFQVGDKIFYPMHGAGIVEKIEEREVLGVRKNYYILQFPFTNMTVLLPMDTVEKAGLREIVDKKSLNKVETFLREKESLSNDNWQQRYRENLSILKNGDIFGMAHVVKSLIQRSRNKGLSNSEKKLLEDAKRYLISEIALIKNIQEEEAEQLIEDSIP